MTDTLQQRLRTDALWHRRRCNDTIAADCDEAADALDQHSGEVARIRSAAESLAQGTLRQAATIAEQAAEIKRLKLAADNADGMAGCMAVFRNDMIEAGVITEAVPPMFMTEAVMQFIAKLRADAERYQHIREYGEPDEGMAYRPDWTPGRYDAAVDAASAALQAGKAGPHDNRKCSRLNCDGNMRPGVYTAQTVSGHPDFPGDTHAVTLSPGGPGRLAECLKCDVCGHSVTDGKAVTP